MSAGGLGSVDFPPAAAGGFKFPRHAVLPCVMISVVTSSHALVLRPQELLLIVAVMEPNSGAFCPAHVIISHVFDLEAEGGRRQRDTTVGGTLKVTNLHRHALVKRFGPRSASILGAIDAPRGFGFTRDGQRALNWRPKTLDAN